MAKLRKALIISVMSITVISMSMLAVPFSVGAAAQAGDLIKMEGLSSVYYLGADGKRYVFPNEATYFSWYSDFSGVVTIPQSELEGYPLGANVTVRPGTKLVKITTNPKVYAVTDGGVLVAIPDEATAKTLYGDNWAQRVVDVPDAFFTNYTISSNEVSSSAYPAGSLVKFGEDATVYYIASDGTARAVASETAFLANRFKWTDVITATIAAPTTGTAIAGAEGDLTDTSSGAGGTAGAGTGLTVSLSSDTPASRSIPSKAYLVPFLSINLTAAADGDVTVEQLVLTRTGTGPADDFAGGYLYDGDTRLTNRRSVNSTEHTVTFNALNYTVPAGSTKVLTLKMDSAATTGYGDTGNHAFEIVSASNVSTNGAVVSGSFPVVGNTMSYSAVEGATVTLTAADDLSDVYVGDTNVRLVDFDIANDSLEIVKISRVRIKNDGTAADGAVNNFSLDLDGTIVAEGVSMVNDYVDFVLDTPFELKKGKSITATVRGDVITDVGKTLKLYLNNIVDFEANGTAYGDFYRAKVVNTSFNSGTTDNITIKGAEINVSFDGPAAQDIKDNATDVVFANFKIMAASEDVNFEKMRVTLTMGTSDDTDIPNNIEMVDDANNAAYTVADPTTGTTHTLDFENVYLEAGVQYNFQIRGDIPDDGSTGQTYTASMSFATGDFSSSYMKATYVDSDTAVAYTDVSSASLTGKAMTIAAPAVYFNKVTTSAASYVENADKVLLYKGKITASGVSDLTVSKVGLAAAFTGTGNNSIDDEYEKLYLYTADDDLGTPLDTESSLADATSVSFSGFNLNIPKGLSNGVVVVVRGDVKNNPTAGTMTLQWSPDATATSYFTVRDDDNDALAVGQYTVTETAGQISTIASQGTYTMAFDSEYTGINANKNVLAGTIALVGRIKLTASNEAVKLEDFTIENNAGSATVDDVAYYNLYAEPEMTTLLGSASPDSARKTLFEDVNIEVPTTGVTYVWVGAVVKGIDYSSSKGPDSTGTAAHTIKLEIASSTGYTVKAVGVSTGETLATNGVASTTETYTSTILGAVVSNITSSFANDLISTGVNDIFSFKVTAPASTNVDYNGEALGIKLATTTFTVATSTGITFTSFKVERVGGANGEKDAKYITASTTTAMGSGTFVINFPATYGTSNNADLTIRPGETAEYVIKATIGGVGANASAKTTIESTSSILNLNYTHATDDSTTDTAAVTPLISGLTSVRGGSLSN